MGIEGGSLVEEPIGLRLFNDYRKNIVHLN